MRLSLEVKPFSFHLVRNLKTFRGIIKEKKGWLIKIKDNSETCGWGEIAPFYPCNIKTYEKIFKALGNSPLRKDLEESILDGPGPLSFGIGSALAELDCLIGSNQSNRWLKAPQSALLLPTDKSLVTQLDTWIKSLEKNHQIMTFKWKVCNQEDHIERQLLHEILKRLPSNSRLRIDANSGWSREQANYWANYFLDDPRLEWLEQPLSTKDYEGLLELSKQIPVALDESLIETPALKSHWKSWQIRHPALEGDPRILLKALNNGIRNICISTSFETGIGRRWINHLSALQQETATPTAPGLAPGWHEESALFSNNPQTVWESV